MINLIVITNIRNVHPNEYDEVWAIVRSIKSNSHYIQHVPELSPSRELFKKYLSLRDMGMWNKESFERYYRPYFVSQINADPWAQSALETLIAKHNSCKKIALVCFCTDADLCHRRIISEMLTERGVENTLS
jgi:uncharacterized protein YeaO (DUF488 family)